MSDVHAQQVYRLLRHVRPIVLNSARVVEQGLGEVGWTVGMRAVVEVLVDAGASTVPDIARRLDLPRQGVQRHVNGLLHRGHVHTRANPAHRRSVLIAVSSAGRASFEQVRASETRGLALLAPECTAADLATAGRVLAALDRDIRAAAHDHPHTAVGTAARASASEPGSRP